LKSKQSPITQFKIDESGIASEVAGIENGPNSATLGDEINVSI